MTVCRRREFLSSLGAAAVAGTAPASGPAPVKLRIGFMTDTHVGTDIACCGRLKAALELFKAHRCDLVVNGGDICDAFSPSGYAAYRETVESVYGGDPKRPKEVYVYAWHDCYRFKPGTPRDDTGKYSQEAFAEARRLLGDPNPGVFYFFELKGYPLVVVPQMLGRPGLPTTADYVALVDRTCTAYPDRPVFVCDHWPPRCTTDRSAHWGGLVSRATFAKHPQLVMLTGHTHGFIASDRYISQEEFTVINGGCLYEARPALAGDQPVARTQQHGVVTLDVSDDRILARRWDVRDGSEIRPDHPWEIALPYEAKTAKWKHARRARECPPDAFRADAAVTVTRATEKRGKDEVTGYELTFPSLGDNTMKYRLTAERREGSGWRTCGWCEAFGEFWLRPSERKGTIRYFYPDDRLDGGCETRFRVEPENHFGIRGKGLVSLAVTVPQKAEETVYATRDPERDLPYVRRKDGVAIPLGADGFHVPNDTQAGVLKLPQGIFSAPGKYRVVADMEMVQPPEAWRFKLSLIEAKSGKTVAGKFVSPLGSPGPQRWVFSFEKSSASDENSFDIAFEWGGISKVRFHALSVSRSGGQTPQ